MGIRLTTHQMEDRFTMGRHVTNRSRGRSAAMAEKRRMMVIMKSDGSVTFKVGRDGQVMATKTWRGNPGDPSRIPVVVFDESNPYDKLTVTTGLR